MDEPLLRRARRRSVLHTTAAIGLVVLLVGSVMFLLTVREQSRALDRELDQVVASADDVSDPPPGEMLARSEPTAPGRAEVTATGAPETAAALTAAVQGPPGRYDTTTSAGTPLRVLVAERPDHVRWAVAANLGPLRRQRIELAAALLFAELAGLAGAVAAAVLLSRRAVAPLALALTDQRRFVADASHELRAPLTVLHTRAQMLARRARTEPPDQLAGHLDELVADTRALGEVVQDLLVSAEVQHHRRADGLVDLGQLARVVVGSMAAYADSRQVQLGVETPDVSGVVGVLGAEPPLRRALTALIDNAIGHVPAGGRVLVRVERNGREVRASVIDNGVGLDPQNVERLFARFAHGRTGAGRRFGLGLALVQHVALAHGGSVLVTGAVGEGAIFTLVLPAADAG